MLISLVYSSQTPIQVSFSFNINALLPTVPVSSVY